MALTLDTRWTEKLRRLPESGMDYQLVRVRLRDGRILEHAAVLNGQILQLADDASPVHSADIVDVELEPAARR